MPTGAGTPRLCAGYGRVDITPRVGVPLAGTIARGGRFANRVRDPLFARAFHLRDGVREATLLCADLLVVPHALHTAVAARAGVDPETLLFSATHTHSAPGGYWDVGPRGETIAGPYDRTFFAHLVDLLSSVVIESRRDLVPGHFEAAVAAVVGASANRRRLFGPVDPDLTLLRFVPSTGSPIDVVSFSAHPVIGSEREPHTVSGDWPGELCRRIEAAGTRPLFFQGAVGGLSPLFPEFPMRLDPHLDLMTGLVERGWREAVARLAPLPDAPLDVRVLHSPSGEVSCRVFPPAWPLAPLCEAALAPLRRYMVGMAERGRDGRASAPLHLLRVGDAALLGTPCDLGVSVSLALKDVLRAAGVRHPIPGSQCDAYVGYVHLPQDYEHVPEPGFREMCLYENAMSLSGWSIGADMVRTVGAALTSVEPTTDGTPINPRNAERRWTPAPRQRTTNP